MKLLIIVFTLFPFLLSASLLVDEVKVYKAAHRMDLIYGGEIIKSYKVMLGSGGTGPKRQEGDKLVPEGQYVLDEKNPNSKYHRAIHISYPNEEDIERAEKEGVPPGGAIFIHGLPNTNSKSIEWLRELLVKIKDRTLFKKIQKKLDWTKGCVATSNKEIEEIYESISTPTPITIYP